MKRPYKPELKVDNKPLIEAKVITYDLIDSSGTVPQIDLRDRQYVRSSKE